MIFTMIQQIMNFLAGGLEPWFLLSYYENIISAILNMPAERYTLRHIPIGPTETRDFYQWVTPDIPTAFFGILIYSTFFLTLAFARYRMRQSKSEQ